MPKKDRDAVTEGLSGILGSTEADLLGNVIRSDRLRAGRADVAPTETVHPEPSTNAAHNYDNVTTNSVIKEYDNLTSTQYDKQTSPTVISEADKLASQPTTERASKKKTPKPAKEDFLEERHREALKMAKSPTTTVTLRIPREINDWLDEYVHRAWPERIRKQELVSEALKMLFTRRGRPGEALIETNLLPETEQ